MSSGIYEILCTPTGQKYIGRTGEFRARKGSHYCQLRAGSHSTVRLQEAWNKYGEAAFHFNILEECPLDQTVALERLYFDFYNEEDFEEGGRLLNTCDAASGTLHHSEETKAKLSEAAQGRDMSDVHAALASARREKELERAGVYQILCIPTNEKYIGRTGSGFDGRWASHRYLLRKNAHGTAKLQERWNEYGSEAFEFSILERCYVEQTIEREQAHLDAYKDRSEVLLNSPNGSAKGPIRMSDSTKALMSAGRKGLPKSEEHAAAISKSKMGHSVSEVTRAAISKTLSGRPGNPKAIAGMVVANTGSTRTPEVIARASAWQDDPEKLAATIAKAVATRKANGKPNPAKGRKQSDAQKASVAKKRAEKIANGYIDPRIGKTPWNKKA